jgi:tetratricopeptide (TPR) repeat protein
MRTHLLGLAVLATAFTGCLKTEPMTAEEMLKYPRPNTESFQSDPKDVRQPKPETCLEAGKMYESLASSANNVAQKRDFAWRGKQAYQQALRLRPGWPAATMGLARIEEQEGNIQQATAYFQQTLQQVTGKDLSDAQACHEAGLYFARQKQFDASMMAMQKAVQIDPSNRTYAMNYGFTLARAGRFDEGYAYFSRIMNPSEAAFQVAQMAKHVGDSQRCRQFTSFALQQNPSNKDAQELLARLDQAVTAGVEQAQHVEATQQ